MKRLPLQASFVTPVCQVGNKLKLFEEDGSLISKHRQIFVIVPTTHKTKKGGTSILCRANQKEVSIPNLEVQPNLPSNFTNTVPCAV